MKPPAQQAGSIRKVRYVMPKLVGSTIYYTLPEAAQELHITVGRLKSYLDQSRLQSERIGRTELIQEQTLRAYLAKRQS